ncbi:MAG TPA: enoyl-CoA hydratase-related protein [Acidimicrobiia bacterium]|nr:enoyl-CoA hydratase-related protein [Acidimicrobiia bacterium]
MSGAVRVEDQGRVRIVTLNRPDALNAFNDAMYDGVRDALVDAQHAKGVACVVVTGEGDRAFSAGQDLGEMAKRPRHDDGKPHGFVPFIEVVETFEKPFIAAVNGLAIGIGTTMLAHADIVIAADSARFRAPFVSLGITMEAGSSYNLPGRIGWQETAHAVFTGAWMDSARAVETGLAWKRVPDDKLMEETLAIAGEIAAMPITGLVATKRLLLATKVEHSKAARAREDAEILALAGGPAQREALAAFREKRPADFTNLPDAE